MKPHSVIPFQSIRQFDIWQYAISHRQLLLRSNPSDGHDSRIEILFKGVEWLQLPSTMYGLAIATESIAKYFSFVCCDRDASRDSLVAYTLTSKEAKGVVIASAVFIVEEDREYWEPSTLFDDGRDNSNIET